MESNAIVRPLNVLEKRLRRRRIVSPIPTPLEELASLASLSAEEKMITSPSPPTSSNPLASSTWVNEGYALKPVFLLRLLQNSKCNVLLVDCRSPIGFALRQINHAGCVNLDIAQDLLTSHKGFSRKSSVVGFLMEHNPAFLLRLQEPGHYSNLVIVDESSTVERCSLKAKELLEMMHLWNDQTKTEVSLLQGGILEFGKAYPMFVVPWPAPEAPDLEEDDAPMPLLLPVDNEKRLAVTSLWEYQKCQGAVIRAIRQIISVKTRSQVLLRIQSALELERNEKSDAIRRHLESLLYEEVKCPVCWEVFPGQVFQCRNGHSCCVGCGSTLTNCPVCRVAWVGDRVRNISLEKLLENSLQVQCLCKTILRMPQAISHVDQCPINKPSVDSLELLQAELVKEKEKDGKWNHDLLKAKTKMLQQEYRWYSGISGVGLMGVREEIWKPLQDLINARRSTIDLLDKQLFEAMFTK